jgi:hypothetical protein
MDTKYDPTRHTADNKRATLVSGIRNTKKVISLRHPDPSLTATATSSATGTLGHGTREEKYQLKKRGATTSTSSTSVNIFQFCSLTSAV